MPSSTPACILSTKSINAILFLIMILFPLMGMGIDLIAPSLPIMSTELKVSSDFIKNLVSAYLFGIAISNFFVGFLSDALGRKKFLIGGLLLYIIVSFIPTLCKNEWLILITRFFQGAAIGTAGVIGRAIMADILPKERILRIAATVSVMWGIGPIIGPLIGGYLQFYFDWQACFYFFAAYGFVGLVFALCVLPETHLNRQALQWSKIKNNLAEIIAHRRYMTIVISMGFTYALLIAFNTLGPFLIQRVLHHSPVYFGRIALFLGVVYITGAITCRQLVSFYAPEILIQYILKAGLSISLLSVIMAYFFSLNINVIVIPTVLVFFTAGIIYPASMGMGIAMFRHLAGSAAAIMSLVTITTTGVLTVFMSSINAKTALTLNWINLIILLVVAFCYRFLPDK